MTWRANHTQATTEEMEFRISEVSDWVREFIREGREHEAGLWATTLAHIGNTLLHLRDTDGKGPL